MNKNCVCASLIIMLQFLFPITSFHRFFFIYFSLHPFSWVLAKSFSSVFFTFLFLSIFIFYLFSTSVSSFSTHPAFSIMSNIVYRQYVDRDNLGVSPLSHPMKVMRIVSTGASILADERPAWMRGWRRLEVSRGKVEFRDGNYRNPELWNQFLKLAKDVGGMEVSIWLAEW